MSNASLTPPNPELEARISKHLDEAVDAYRDFVNATRWPDGYSSQDLYVRKAVRTAIRAFLQEEQKRSWPAIRAPEMIAVTPPQGGCGSTVRL